MIRTQMLCVTLTLLAGSAATLSSAQFVLPAEYASTEGPSVISGPLANADLTLQWLFDGSQLSGVPAGSRLTAIGFRLDAGQPDRPGIDHLFDIWDLQLSSSLNPAGALDAVFANNIAADAVTVRSGSYTLATNSLLGGAGPNELFFIPFITPYLYSGGDLLITLRQNATVGASLLSLDGIALADLTGVADSVRASGADAVSGQAQFSNIPVTAFQYTAVPEPGSALLLLGSLLAGAALRRRIAR